MENQKQEGVKKHVIFHPKCRKDYEKLSRQIKLKFLGLFVGLEKRGFLAEPAAKKLVGHQNLFELRLKYKGNWRIFYGYILDNKVLMLHIINKKVQKTSTKDINLAIKRLNEYKQ